jgi:hypothetical protein
VPVTLAVSGTATQARHICRVAPSEDCAQADPFIVVGRER